MTALPARRSAVWSLAFRAGYRLLRLLDPLLRSWIANGYAGLDGVIELRTIGRRTGRSRRTLLTLLVVDGHGYVGHPNGEAAWIANAEASGWVEVGDDSSMRRVPVTRLGVGRERDDVILATSSQQPFPANLLYRAARRHIAAVGVYLRLGEPGTGGPSPVMASARTLAR